MNPSDISEAVSRLRQGQLVLFPAEEGWVVGCDASQAPAVERLLTLKKTDEPGAVTVLIGEIGQLQQYVRKVPEIAWDLVEFAEKPLTVTYADGQHVPPGVLSPEGRIAIRLVKAAAGFSTLAWPLVKRFGRGVATVRTAPPAPTLVVNPGETGAQLNKTADYALALGQLFPGQPMLATLVRLELNGQITFLRK